METVSAKDVKVGGLYDFSDYPLHHRVPPITKRNMHDHYGEIIAVHDAENDTVELEVEFHGHIDDVKMEPDFKLAVAPV